MWGLFSSRLIVVFRCVFFIFSPFWGKEICLVWFGIFLECLLTFKKLTRMLLVRRRNSNQHLKISRGVRNVFISFQNHNADWIVHAAFKSIPHGYIGFSIFRPTSIRYRLQYSKLYIYYKSNIFFSAPPSHYRNWKSRSCSMALLENAF